MFVPGKPFQPSLVLAGKAGAYLSEALLRLSGTPLFGGLQDSHTNTRLGRKGSPWTNTLAYYKIQ